MVEEATPSDHSVLAEIHERSFPSGWSEDDLAALARQPGVTILQARRSSLLGSRSILGFVILRVAADEAEVLTIAVDPRQRQRGVGALLMRHALSRLYADRIASLFLEVDAANAPALALYRRLGFRKVGETARLLSRQRGRRRCACHAGRSGVIGLAVAQGPQAGRNAGRRA